MILSFKIHIIDDSLEKYKTFLKQNRKFLLQEEINITISKQYSIALLNIDLINLLFINIKTAAAEEVIQKYQDKNKYLVYLVEDEEDLKSFPLNLDYSNTLSLPPDEDELLNIIHHYLDLLKKDQLLKKERELSSSIINSIKNPIFSINKGKINFVNEYFLKLVNCKDLDEVNNKYYDINNIFESLSNDWLSMSEEKNRKVSIVDKYGNGKYFLMQKIFLVENDINLIILNDITYEEKHRNDLYKLLYNDNLTNLPNRRNLIEALQSKRLKLNAICMVDINSFKEINDFFGHKIGDQILIEIAQFIQERIKIHKSLTLYKFPADTYCITNENCDKEKFIELVSQLTEEIYKRIFMIEQYEIDIRVTAGISFSNKNNKLITADIALETAKKDKKDYLVFYDELDKFKEYENNMLWTKKLKTALINDNIEVYYQPLVNNKTLKIEKYECLVRLIDDEGKVVSPYFFLDISKKTNQYTKITKIVIQKAFKKFENLPFEFSVNISYEDIEDPEFLAFIKEMIKKYKVSKKVVFEILEDESIKNYNTLISFIDEIKALGCKVAIDDFGSGYSNFEHLLKMNIDYLKIDASLIKNIAADENSYKVTKTIINFARNLNLKTIAEFVENEEIYNIVKELKVDFSQGYFFSPPISSPNDTK